MRIRTVSTTLVVLILARGVRAADAPGVVFFEQNVRPLLVARCYECHSEKKQKGGLRLDSKAALLKGGDSGKWNAREASIPPRHRASLG